MATIHVFDTGITQIIDRAGNNKFNSSLINSDAYNNFLQEVETYLPVSKIPPPFRIITIFEDKIVAIYYQTPLVIDEGPLKQLYKIKIDTANFNSVVLDNFKLAVQEVRPRT